jgi:site-specific recombinase XerD
MSTSPLRVIDGGRVPRGWEDLWARDQWRQHELPHGDLQNESGREAVVRFERLMQPWIKEAAKRWVRARLLASIAPQSMNNYLLHLWAFSGWLAERAPEVGGPGALTRELLEDYMLAVRTSRLASGTKTARIGTLRAFLEEQREDGLARLPRSTTIHAAEVPRGDYRLPKGMEAHVFDQFVDPTNLSLLPSEQHRTAVLLLAFTGLRVSSVVTLRRDALQIGSDNHPYLRYRNVKLRREAVIPIGPALCDQLRRQERYLNEMHGNDGTEFLLPSPPARRRGTSLGGGYHVSRELIRQTIKRYVLKAEIRDSHGELATWVHPHLFRHHLGTSMVNDGVPLPVIQKVLDHASIEMTGRYAHLHDETLRREMLRWQERVNIRGERIALTVDGPLEQAAWMKERISRARQALPNGYCGLPLVQTCPHPNACLSCDSFLTDNSFRPIHEQQLERTRTMLTDARERDAARLVDVLERDELSLARIIDGLEALDSSPGEPLDLISKAQAPQAR